jgi:hypothetical protein
MSDVGDVFQEEQRDVGEDWEERRWVAGTFVGRGRKLRRLTVPFHALHSSMLRPGSGVLRLLQFCAALRETEEVSVLVCCFSSQSRLTRRDPFSQIKSFDFCQEMVSSYFTDDAGISISAVDNAMSEHKSFGASEVS